MRRLRQRKEVTTRADEASWRWATTNVLPFSGADSLTLSTFLRSFLASRTSFPFIVNRIEAREKGVTVDG